MIGDRVKEMRLKMGMSMDDLAKMVGISRQAVYKYENGIVTNIPTIRLSAIAKALKTTPGWLMEWGDEYPTSSEGKEPLGKQETPAEARDVVAGLSELLDSIQDLDEEQASKTLEYIQFLKLKRMQDSLPPHRA